MNLINFIKHKLGISELERKQREVDQILDILKTLTRTDVDIDLRGRNTIVLTGYYKGRGFVKFQDVDTKYFEEIANQLKRYDKISMYRHADCPPNLIGAFEV